MDGNLSSREDNVGGSQRFSHWIGHDLYNFIICRDLAQNTFTHVPCGISIRGREEVEEHLGTCDSNNPPENTATCYSVPGLPDCIYTFGWAFFCDGYWHLEVNYKENVFGPCGLHAPPMVLAFTSKTGHFLYRYFSLFLSKHFFLPT